MTLLAIEAFTLSKKIANLLFEKGVSEDEIYGIFSDLAIEDEDFIWVDGTPSYTQDYEPVFKVFNIYLIP